jgi:5-bromo-4-chloroindolyl phosphate hydrolysis protein
MEAICCTGERIIGEVRTNPEGLKHVRKFFYYYLDAFGEIAKKYLRLSSFEESSEEVRKLVAETEKSFNDIDEIFKDLCEKLLEKDMMHLKAEINVIKNSN